MWGGLGRRGRGLARATLDRRGCPRGPERRQRLRRVLPLEQVVVRLRQLPRGAIELDLLQGPERDGARREVILGIVAFVLVREGRLRQRGPEDGPQDEDDRA
ncbi:MAG TPA: hypothetical protein VM736_01105 [Gemmatimonadales bacterium]|nr:hypothetical protein [Gemmatimonadales bacterium]